MKRRILSFLLVLTMILGTLGQGSICLAEETENTVTSSPEVVSDVDTETGEIKDVIVVNPFAEEIYSEEAIDEMIASLEKQVEENKKENHYSDNVDFSTTVYTNLEDAAEHLREQMVARDEVAAVTVNMESLGTEDFYDTYPLLWDAAVAYSEECTGQEGDALKLGWSTYSVGGSYGSNSVTVEFTVTWRTTAEQEAELTTAVDAALEELALDGKTDYQKARAIYDFVCDTVDYDYEHLNSDEDYPLMYTSYAAMCNGTSVCQGYALLYYRMCKDAGLSARYIRGYANGGNHGWNIVRIGDVYYNADTTWDGQDEETYHDYFLENTIDFTGHTRRDEYDTEEFHAEFPMAADSWSDYSNLSETTVFENYDTVTFNTVDGGTATNTANSKVKLLVFGRVTCTYTRNTISNLSQGDFDDIDIVYCDFDQNDLAAVTEFRDTYGSSTDGIAYAYSEDYSIYYLMWDYVDLYSTSGSVSLPVLVFINEDNEVAHYAAGGTMSASYVRTCIDTYMGDYELIEISDETLTMNEGDTKTPQVTIQGIVRNNQFLTWSSSNTSVAAVDATGKITAKAAGTATITCKANDDVYVTCQVTVKGNVVLDTPAISSVSNQTNGVKVVWSAVEGAEKYRVFRKTATTGWKTVANTTSTSFTDTTVESGTTYIYTVRCISEDGSSFTSNYDTKGKSITYIQAPKMSGVSLHANGVKVTWNVVTGAEKYKVFRKTSSTSWIVVGETTSNTYIDTTAESGTTYTYTVRCASSDGKTFTSAYDSVGKSLYYIAAPVISKVEGYEKGINIQWNAVAGAERYRVFRKTATTGWAVVKNTTSTSFTDTAVEEGTTYIYTVRCINSAGAFTSAYDTTGKGITYTAAPTVSGVSLHASGVKITWGSVTGAEKYRVFRKTATGSWTSVGETTSTSFIDTKAVSGTTYSYTVRCISSDGKSYTGAFDTTGKSISYIAAPVITKMEGYAKGINVKWNAVAGAEKYRVFRKTATSGWVAVKTTTATSFTDTTVEEGTTYIYTVRCMNSSGAFTSAYDTVGKSITYAAMPQLSSATAVTNGVKVTWNAAEGAEKYCVFRKTASGSWTIVGYTTGISFTDTTAVSGTTYTYTVRCVSSDAKYFTSAYDTTGVSIKY